MAHNAVGSLCRSSKHAGLSRTTLPNLKTSNAVSSNIWQLTKMAAMCSSLRADTCYKWHNPTSQKSVSTSLRNFNSLDTRYKTQKRLTLVSLFYYQHFILFFYKFKRLCACFGCNINNIDTCSKTISTNLTNRIIFRCTICRN